VNFLKRANVDFLEENRLGSRGSGLGHFGKCFRSGLAAETVFAGVKANEQAGVVDGNFDVSLAGAAETAAEFEGDFFDRLDAAADQDFEQQLEAGFLKLDPVQASAANHEEAGHRVFGADFALLQGPGDPDGGGGEEFAGWVPLAQAAAGSVAATDDDIAVAQDGGEQAGKKLGGVLEVGVHDAEDGGVGVLPAMQDGAGKSSRAFANQEADAGILSGYGGDDISGAVATVVVDDEDLIGDGQRIEDAADVVDESCDIFGFAEGRNHECKLALFRPDERSRRRAQFCSGVCRHIRWFHYC